MDVNDLAGKMIAAGKTAVGGIWEQMETYAVPELKKIAIQIEAIAEHCADYTLEGAKALLDMQVIVAMTSLTLLVVQDAINAILGAVRDFVNGAVGIALL